nr:Uncharacterized conserved protein [Streptococcus thermophilus]VDG64675.1 Uncharacterized conserved protein [Streptococcus thermophilus]
MAAIFKTISWQVEQLVSGVQQGSISLPDLQRPFVWPATKVRDLFDSMYKGYPVGALMFWDVPEEGATRKISSGNGVKAQHQIIDGQQRLTSLFAAIKGVEVQDENYRRRRITISFNPFTERFEVRSVAIAKSPEWIDDIAKVWHHDFDFDDDFIDPLEEAGREFDKEQKRHLRRVVQRLQAIESYSFDVVHIQDDVEKRLVADIFVRINSEGVSLKSYDYILTWLSVFWPKGRDKIEEFAHFSRITPQRASEIKREQVNWTPWNPFWKIDTGYIVRAMVAFGQNRAKLLDAYSNLQAKNRTTGQVDPEKQERELQLLKDALPVVTNHINWTEYIHSLQIAGFRSERDITSDFNKLASYVLFLIGRERFNVELTELRTLVARWFFMSQLTARYTGSSESQLQRDLDMFDAPEVKDAEAFRKLVEDGIRVTLTNDFWEVNLPQQLVSSQYRLSPGYLCYLASLNVLDADMFMLPMKVSHWMDPSIPAEKGTEGHHLFPRAYQQRELGITDNKRINQAANFAPTDWQTNSIISDRDPAEYWPKLVDERSSGPEWLAQQTYWHALPDDWHLMPYTEFLEQRRELIAQVTRDGFERLGSIHKVPDLETQVPLAVVDDLELSLSELVESCYLLPGDLLDPIDPDWVVDAIITEDRTVRIDGEKDFDSLDEAAQYLGVSNLSGFQFWALEKDGGLASMSEVVTAGPREPEPVPEVGTATQC